jgi:hypothetical protein
VVENKLRTEEKNLGITLSDSIFFFFKNRFKLYIVGKFKYIVLIIYLDIQSKNYVILCAKNI